MITGGNRSNRVGSIRVSFNFGPGLVGLFMHWVGSGQENRTHVNLCG